MNFGAHGVEFGKPEGLLVVDFCCRGGQCGSHCFFSLFRALNGPTCLGLGRVGKRLAGSNPGEGLVFSTVDELDASRVKMVGDRFDKLAGRPVSLTAEAAGDFFKYALQRGCGAHTKRARRPAQVVRTDGDETLPDAWEACLSEEGGNYFGMMLADISIDNLQHLAQKLYVQELVCAVSHALQSKTVFGAGAEVQDFLEGGIQFEEGGQAVGSSAPA